LKPIHLNLAARPYRDYRPVYAVVVVTSIVVAFLMLNNIDTYYRYVRDTKNTRNEINAIEVQIRQEKNRAEAAQREIGTIDLSSLSKQSKFVNAQLAERAFSWSELLDRLEAVLPGTVRITNISPQFAENGLVHLSVTCEAKTADSMLTTITRFQKDPHFANPFPTAQTTTPAGFQFGIGVDYKPTIARVVQ
jgi:Tfp pilus assembly protein PilN